MGVSSEAQIFAKHPVGPPNRHPASSRILGLSDDQALLKYSDQWLAPGC